MLRNRAFLPRSCCARSDTAGKSCCLLKRKIMHLNCFQWPGLLFWFLAKRTALEEIPVTNCLLPLPSPCESSTREQHGTATVLSVAAARLLSSSAARRCPTWASDTPRGSKIRNHIQNLWPIFHPSWFKQDMPPWCCRRGFQKVSHSRAAYDKKCKKSLQIKELTLCCNLCRKKFTRHFLLGSASADSTSRSFDSCKALSKYLSQSAFAWNLQSRASCAAQHASMLVKNPFWMPVTALLSTLHSVSSHFLDLVFTSMALTHFLAQLQLCWLAQTLLHKQQSVSWAVTPPRRRCADCIWHWHTNWIKISKKGSSGVGVFVDPLAWLHRCCSNRFFFLTTVRKSWSWRRSTTHGVTVVCGMRSCVTNVPVILSSCLQTTHLATELLWLLISYHQQPLSALSHLQLDQAEDKEAMKMICRLLLQRLSSGLCWATEYCLVP